MTEADLDRLARALAPALRQHIPPPMPSAHSDERRDVNVEKSGVWMDYKTMVGALCALAVSAWIGSGWFAQLQYEMREVRTLLTNIPRQVEQTVQAVRDSLSERIQRLESSSRIVDPDRYGRTAHDLWCLETEKLNRDIGWDCAEVPGHDRRSQKHDMQPSEYYSGWMTEMTKEKAVTP